MGKLQAIDESGRNVVKTLQKNMQKVYEGDHPDIHSKAATDLVNDVVRDAEDYRRA